MKTADEMKCERKEKSEEQSGYISASALFDNHQEREGSFDGTNLDDLQIAFKTFSGNGIQFDGKGSWVYVPDTFKVLVDNANDGICIVHEDMRHAYVNRKYCEIMGYSDSELMMIRMVDLISTDKREAFKKMYQQSFLDETKMDKNYVATVIRKDGKKCSIECSRSRVVWNGKSAIQGIIRDITENIEKEKKIEETNKLLSNQIEGITAKLISSSEKLKQQQSELICRKLELENVNKELLQTNRAMSILARNIDKEKKEVEQKIAHTVITKIIPIINDLKKEKALQKHIAEIEVLSSYVKGLASEADQYNKIAIILSAGEMRVATLIKNGMSSQSIADALNISLETVKTHRKKIRKKLKIINSDYNLTSYLQSVMTVS